MFTADDDKRTEAATHATVAKLQRLTDTEGVTAAIAEAIGIMWGIAHVFKTLGLKDIHRLMRRKLADYMNGK